MSDFVGAELNPPVRVLLGPGPSDTHPRVLRALAANTVGHLDPYYLELMNGMQQMLRTVMRTQNRMTMAVAATGSAGMEATVVNLIEPGDSMVVCVNGVFGGRMVDVAEGAGDAYARRSSVGRSVPSGRLEGRARQGEAQTRRHRDGRNVDRRVATDRGNCSIGARCRALLLVDAVTASAACRSKSIAGKSTPLFRHEKCLGCPPGLAPVTFSDRAMEVVLAKDKGAKLVSRRLDARQVLGAGTRLSPHRADQYDLRPVRGAA